MGGAIETVQGNFSCTVYQDVAIPAGATTASLSFDGGVLYNMDKSHLNAVLFWGLYATSSIPAYDSLRIHSIAFGSGQYEPGTSDTALQQFTFPNVNVSSIAGTTVRLAFIAGTDSTTGNLVVGLDNVVLTATAPPPPPTSVPALGVGGMFGLGGLLLSGWWWLRRPEERSV